MKDYQSEWTITPDWFFAPDHDNDFSANTADNFDAFGESHLNRVRSCGARTTRTAMASPRWDRCRIWFQSWIFMASRQGLFAIPSRWRSRILISCSRRRPRAAVHRHGNRLCRLELQRRVRRQRCAACPTSTVYVDANRNGVYENGETSVVTDVDGKYTLPVPSTVAGTFSIGVRLPGPFGSSSSRAPACRM